jgi:hypothetical protein
MLTPEQIAVFQRARQLIAGPTQWCQWHFALDEDREVCDPRSREARKFCAAGAILRAAHDLDVCIPPWCWTELTVINDLGDHAAVLAFFDKASRAQAP